MARKSMTYTFLPWWLCYVRASKCQEASLHLTCCRQHTLQEILLEGHNEHVATLCEKCIIFLLVSVTKVIVVKMTDDLNLTLMVFSLEIILGISHISHAAFCFLSQARCGSLLFTFRMSAAP